MFKPSGLKLLDIKFNKSISANFQSQRSEINLSTTDFDSHSISVDICSNIGKLKYTSNPPTSSQIILSPMLSLWGEDLKFTIFVADQSNFTLSKTIQLWKESYFKIDFQTAQKVIQNEIGYQYLFESGINFKAIYSIKYPHPQPQIQIEINGTEFQNTYQYFFLSKEFHFFFQQKTLDLNVGADLKLEPSKATNIQGFLKFNSFPLVKPSILYKFHNGRNSVLLSSSIKFSKKYDHKFVFSLKPHIYVKREDFNLSNLLNKLKFGFQSQVHPTIHVQGLFSLKNGVILFLKSQLTDHISIQLGSQLQNFFNSSSPQKPIFSFLFTSDEKSSSISFYSSFKDRFFKIL